MANEKELKVAVSKLKTPVVKKTPVKEVMGLIEKLDVVDRHEVLLKQLVAGGKPVPLFNTNYDKFLNFVKTNKITAEKTVTAVASKATLTISDIKDFAGGKKVNHLHLGGKIYQLTDVQWASFTKEFAPNIAAEIQKINTIQF